MSGKDLVRAVTRNLLPVNPARGARLKAHPLERRAKRDLYCIMTERNGTRSGTPRSKPICRSAIKMDIQMAAQSRRPARSARNMNW